MYLALPRLRLDFPATLALSMALSALFAGTTQATELPPGFVETVVVSLSVLFVSSGSREEGTGAGSTPTCGAT